MRYILILFLFFSLGMYSQKKTFSYNQTPLNQVIDELEEDFNVRFSFNTKLLKDKSVTYNSASNLKDFLDRLSYDLNLDFVFLDDENIIIKASDFPDDYNNLLEEVVLVTEYLTSGFDQNKEDGSVTMKPNKLGVLPGLTDPDVLQSLQLLPGISSPTESASNLHIRGGTPDQNLILYDGIKVYHQGHLFGMISPFNPYVVESVNVFRSGTKSEFGDRIAGVVDINSMIDVPNQFSGGGGVNFLHADAFIKTPIEEDKIGLLMSVRRSINDLVDLPTFNSFTNKVFQNTAIEEVNNLVQEEELTVLENRFDFIDVNTKLIFQPNTKHKIAISGLYVNNSLNFANEDSENYGARDQLDLSNSGFSAYWNFTPSDSWAFKSLIRYSGFELDYKYDEFEQEVIEESYSNKNTVDDLGLLFQGIHAISKTTNAKVGYEFVTYKVDYDLRYNDDDFVQEIVDTQLDTHSLFGELEHQSNRFYIRGGLRTSFFTNDNSTYFEPRLYTNYKLSDYFQLKASAEIKNQAISQLVSFELNDFGLGNTVWALTDEEEGIPVLNNRQFTFGFFYNKDGWKLDVESYFKKIKGLTSFTRGFRSNNLIPDYATGNSTIVGFDVLIKKKINKFRTWVGYSFSKNDFEFPDLQSEKFPGNFDQRHVLSWTNTLKYKKFQFSLGWQFATGKPYSEVSGLSGGEFVFGQQNQSRLSNYHKLDFSGFYDFYLDTKKEVRARLGISVINLYDRDNEIDRNYNIRQDDNDVDFLVEQTSVGLGITPNVVFRVYF